MRFGRVFKAGRKMEQGRCIELTLPMEFKAVITQNNSVSIKYGAVLFAVKIEENWQKTTYTVDWNKGYNYLDGKYSNYNITAASDFNYALADFNFDDIKSNFEVHKNPISDNMRYVQSRSTIIPLKYLTRLKNASKKITL